MSGWCQWTPRGNNSGGPICKSVQFSHSVGSNSLQHHELQHVRSPCPSTTPRIYPNHVHWVGDAIQLSHPLLTPLIDTNIQRHIHPLKDIHTHTHTERHILWKRHTHMKLRERHATRESTHTLTHTQTQTHTDTRWERDIHTEGGHTQTHRETDTRRDTHTHTNMRDTHT